jgi:macrodomain Ter protein organizer (MatP/YcbG family)
MRRAGWYDNEPTVEEKKEADKIIEEVTKEVEMSPEYLINYIDEHFNSLIMDKMISVLHSKSKAKYNLEVADKLMGELNKAYNYSLEKDNEV